MFRRHVKFSFVLICVTYIFTLWLIYKCVPSLFSEVDNSKLTNGASISGSNWHVPNDNYKLKWQPKEKKFFKKVRSQIKKPYIHRDADDNDDIAKCSANLNRLDMFNTLVDGFFIYSSYFDNRSGQPFIRMIGAMKQNLTEVIEHKTWCHFQIPNSGHIPSHASSKVTFYEMCENHDRPFGGWIVSCKVPSVIKTIPEGFRVGYGQTEQDSLHKSNTLCINVRDKRITRRKLKFGVCVPPLYGLLKPNALIEFIEMNRILGAEMFTFYIEKSDREVSTEMNRILRHYEAINVATLIYWQVPVSNKLIWYHGQSLAINDCVYRNMDNFEYLAFIDIDEFIIPHEHLFSWHEVIDNLASINETQFENASGFTFKSAFYSEEFSRRVFSDEMIISVRTNRTRKFSIFRNKVMVRPSRILELGIHHVSRAWPDDKKYSVLKVEPHVAHIHHYRSCVLEFGIHCKSRVEDNTVPQKYGKFLVDNYLKVVFEITP